MKKYIFTWIAVFAIAAISCNEDEQKNKPAVQTNDVSGITIDAASVNGTVVSEGSEALIARGICYNVRPQPTIEQSKIEERENIGAGAFSAQLTGLTHHTKYYVRAYARNAYGTTYGEELEFTTLRIYAAPEVTTVAATNVEYTTATIGGNVTGDGGKTLTAVGVVYSEVENPTLETGSKAFASANQIGAFTCDLSDLKQLTTYYFKAFATNDQGTTYGVQMSFTTRAEQAIPPTVITTAVVIKAIKGAAMPGRITSTGGDDIIRRGVCWTDGHDVDPDTFLLTKRTDKENITGDFSFRVTSSLEPNTTYRFRAFAENSAGLSYGDVVEFTTDTGDELILVEAGTFQMGIDESEISGIDLVGANGVDHSQTFRDQGPFPKHAVTISKNYYIGKYELTCRDYAEFLNDMGATGSSPINAPDGHKYAGKRLLSVYNVNISLGTSGYAPAAEKDHCPCGGITWIGAKAYCEWKSAKTGKKYRLPTEAEWEFAARGGNLSKGFLFSGSNTSTDVGVVKGANAQTAILVGGTKQPNELGIFDMTGNLLEFTSDYSNNNEYAQRAANAPVVDPKGPSEPVETPNTTGHYCIMRGGYYFNDMIYCEYVFGRLSKSNATVNTEEGVGVRNGFRIVLEVD